VHRHLLLEHCLRHHALLPLHGSLYLQSHPRLLVARPPSHVHNQFEVV
jgi:hypothetical protein